MGIILSFMIQILLASQVRYPNSLSLRWEGFFSVNILKSF